MVKRIKPSQLKPLLKEYLSSGDFAKPFVVAGWRSTGKSTIVSETLDEVFGKHKHYQAVKSPTDLTSYEEDKEYTYPCLNISIQSERDALEQMQDYENFFLSNHIRPIIIEQTYETEDFIEKLGRFADVYVVDFDREEWIEWMKSKEVMANDFIELMRTLPITQILTTGKTYGCTYPTPKRWFEVGKLWLHFSNIVSQLGSDACKAVAEALAK